LDKTIRNTYDPENPRGVEKYQRAKKVLKYLEKTDWIDSPDIIWGKDILESYELWKNGKYSYNKVSEENTEPYLKGFKDVIYDRRSVRFWKKAEIPEEDIIKILEMGTMAPTSCNRQPYKFIVVKNTNEHLDQLGTTNKDLIAKAPYTLYVTIDRRLYPEKYAPSIDAGIISQNLMLAIAYYGYGGCPMYHCEAYDQKKLREILELTPHDYIYLAIPFGVPAEHPATPVRIPVSRVARFAKTNSKIISEKM